MNVQLHFSHMDVPQYLREQINDLVEEHLFDLKENINLELFCSKEAHNAKSGDSKYKCFIEAHIINLNKRISINETGDDCWALIHKTVRTLRHQILTKKRILRSARHRKNEKFESRETPQVAE